jgi:hypothetical protein
MSVLTDFKNKLLGIYHNRTQAFSYPQKWAYINVSFEEVCENEIRSDSWYFIKSRNEPYRSSLLKLKESGDQVIMTPINRITDTESCDIIFSYMDNYWVGENLKCIIPKKEIYVSTSLKFDGVNYFSRDAGYDLKTNKFLWGKKSEEGYFHFIKQ